ncbi:hypothetical protein GOM49_13450 [Clostridium bovifaecis]|uniref:Uncharacterized protein n=1 Tax=Clostridium bovifaecis TaxID=2184719 RepID=A0A6I6EQM2_9CLOT|nr:hypothetical protein GOM49_13450 [Clostridium bovifaecis]
MKKLLVLSITAITLITTSNQVFAASHVSEMTATKGGRHVAECAQKMNKGISECAKTIECQEEI